MGADGPGLFSDDTACDVRDEYRMALEASASDSDAEAAVRRQFADGLSDPDERIVVVLALAFTESKLGRLSDETRREALAVLDAGGDLERWQEAGRTAVRRRAATLEKVRRQLESKQAAPRKIRRRSLPQPSLAVGDVLAYRAESGRVHLMRVAGHLDMGDCIQTAIRFMDYAQNQLPSPELLATIPDRKRHPNWKNTELRITDDSAQSREQFGVTVVGTLAAPQISNAVDPKRAATWPEIVYYLKTRDQLITSSCRVNDVL